MSQQSRAYWQKYMQKFHILATHINIMENNTPNTLCTFKTPKFLVCSYKMDNSLFSLFNSSALSQ